MAVALASRAATAASSLFSYTISVTNWAAASGSEPPGAANRTIKLRPSIR